MPKVETVQASSERSRLRLWPTGWFDVVIAAAFLPATLPGASFVVDPAAAAADDNPGNEAKPLKSIQRAVDLAKPGDTVSVMEGRYAERVGAKRRDGRCANHGSGGAQAFGRSEWIRRAG